MHEYSMNKLARRPIRMLLILAAWHTLPQFALAQTSLGTGFTYQGLLRQSGVPINGTVALRFTLWDGPGAGSPPTGANQIGAAQQMSGVPLVDGLFTVTLNDTGQFGPSAYNGQARWLQIAVCGDPACTTTTILAPRQPITPAPYASFAAAPWTQPIAGSADIAYAAGNVAIGTSSTTAGLQVKHEPTTTSGTLAIEGTTHTYISFFPDGFAAGRKAFFGFPCGTCNDISLTNQISGGGLSLAAGTGGNLTISANRVGIGTTSPATTLDVRGDIRLGSTGQLFAPGGEENLRMIRGMVSSSGAVLVGTGFTAQHSAPTGFYSISFTTPFLNSPTVVASVEGNTAVFAVAQPNGVSSVGFGLFVRNLDNHYEDAPFHFIAVGPR